MVSHVRRPAVLLRLSAAGLLAVTVLAGTATGTVADIASACAAPPGGGLDRGRFDSCVATAVGQYERDEITLEELDEELWTCCYESGGEWTFGEGGGCKAPAEDSPAQLPRFPDLGDVATATLTPAPPAGPIGRAPVEATLAPFG